MKEFACSCGKNWSFEEIVPSVFEFGFINLINIDNEIIAFNCPENTGRCSLIKYNTYPGGTRNFLDRLSENLNPSGYFNKIFNFYYLSSIPFSKKNAIVLDGFDVYEFISSSSEFEGYGFPVPSDGNYYYTFNPNIDTSFTSNIRVLKIKSGDVDRLLAIEEKNQTRIIPRYVVWNELLYLIDIYLWYHYGDIKSLVKFVSSGEKLPEFEPKNLPIDNFSILYKILSSDVYKQITAFTVSSYDELEKYKDEHSVFVDGTIDIFNSGKLNEIMSELSRDFLINFNAENFGYANIWKYKEQYLKRLYLACKDGTINKNKKRKPTARDLAEAQCRALAQKFWDQDPTITIADMCKNKELIEASGGAYISRTLRKWIDDLAPNHKPGRRPIKK